MEFRSRSDIRELHDAFLARRPALHAEFGGLGVAAFNWAPAQGRWSVAQCIDHLCQTGACWTGHLSPILFDALAHGVHHREPYRPGPVGHRVIRAMEVPTRRLNAPAPFVPRDHAAQDPAEPADLLRAFDALGESWEATLRRCSQLDLARLRVSSPAARWMRMPLGTWLYGLSAHEHRHIEQARRVMAEPGFPR